MPFYYFLSKQVIYATKHSMAYRSHYGTLYSYAKEAVIVMCIN